MHRICTAYATDGSRTGQSWQRHQGAEESVFWCGARVGGGIDKRACRGIRRVVLMVVLIVVLYCWD